MLETTEVSPRRHAFAAFMQGKVTAPWLVAPVPLLILLLGMVALRFWVAGHMDFETDEAYYWLWSRHLATGYFDHPPMIAYLLRLGTALFGDTILGIRSMAILAMILVSVLLYALALILFGERRIGLLAVLWFNMTPHSTIFSVIMSIDTPALLFWLLSCVGLGLVWRSGRGEWWYLVGVALGCLMLSKYTGVFLLFGIAAWLLISTEMRPWLKRREPYIAAVFALILFSPVILWNAQHGWASFIKQFGRALHSSPDGGLANAAVFVGGQAVFVSPLIFAFAVAGLAVALLHGLRRQEANWLLLALTSGPMLVYFLVHALSAEVQTQWPSAAYPAGVLAAVAAFAMRTGDSKYRPLVRHSFQAAPWVGLVLTLALCLQLTLAPLPVSAASDPLKKFSGWAELASETRAIADAQHAEYIATDDYGINGALAFYLRDITVFQASEAIRYASQPPLDQALLARTTGIYLAAAYFRDDLAEMKTHYDSVELVSTIWRTRRGDPIEPLRVYRLSGYRGGLPY